MRKTEHNKSKPGKLRFYPKSAHPPKVDEEIRSNIGKFLGHTNGNPEFKYYRNLKDQIALLTKGRCSYCGKYTDLSIEHYRPKDGIAVDLTRPRNINKPGYFWLASDWYNLHPACTPCNALKTREIVDPISNKGIAKVVGKGNLFPLYQNSIHAPLLIQQATKHSLSLSTKKVKKERPLLFNPSKMLPKELFRYCIVKGRRGSLMLIAPKVGISQYRQAIAETTIDVLGLNSKDHAKARSDVHTLTKDALINIEAIGDFDDGDCLEELANLCSYIDESENGSYLGMIEAIFGYKLRTLASQIDTHLTIPVAAHYSLTDVVKSIDRLLDTTN
ncbi:TPA: hypothetical protein ACX3FR_000081 [Vibrio parahaemolyticus]|uniref:hypothetical protein n=1 Tax=Vibrio parahaemolyticus TaxID=670 RepID=UPI001E2F72F0|nr:hypothetical protein [Vibrio parahaemolyticus]